MRAYQTATAVATPLDFISSLCCFGGFSDSWPSFYSLIGSFDHNGWINNGVAEPHRSKVKSVL